MRVRFDRADRLILSALQQDARLSMRELGRKVGLSAPAVTERVRRLEEEGVISGYSAKLVPARLGRQITAFIGVQDSGQRDPQLIHWSEEHPAVLECHSVTGENSCMLRVAVESVADLETLLSQLIAMGFTCSTSIVLSSPVAGKPVLPASHLAPQAAQNPSQNLSKKERP